MRRPIFLFLPLKLLSRRILASFIVETFVTRRSRRRQKIDSIVWRGVLLRNLFAIVAIPKTLLPSNPCLCHFCYSFSMFPFKEKNSLPTFPRYSIAENRLSIHFHFGGSQRREGKHLPASMMMICTFEELFPPEQQ